MLKLERWWESFPDLSLPRTPTTPGGLNSGEHYTTSPGELLWFLHKPTLADFLQRDCFRHFF